MTASDTKTYFATDIVSMVATGDHARISKRAKEAVSALDHASWENARVVLPAKATKPSHA